MVSFEEEVFNLILSNKISIFDFTFEIRCSYPTLYHAEFRRTRGNTDQLRKTIDRVRDDISSLSEEDWRTREHLQDLCYTHEKFFLK